jgi:signal transduction histidine kinase
MKNRATLIGAIFSISSRINQGTDVHIRLPFNGDTNERTTKN